MVPEPVPVPEPEVPAPDPEVPLVPVLPDAVVEVPVDLDDPLFAFTDGSSAEGQGRRCYRGQHCHTHN